MKTVARFALLATASMTLCSCFGLILDAVGPKPEYTGPKPPSVVAADQVNSARRLQRDPYELPPSTQLSDKQIKRASDGIPYGIESPYRNCVHSPYTPFPRLDTTGLKSGQLVYDPYELKPFYLP